jgi:hypothetical protein
MFKHLIPVLAVLLMDARLHAQNLVDITVAPGQNNDLEVRLRPSADFDGLCSSIVFAIRWSNASGANLGSVQQTIEQQDVLDISAVGSEQVDGPYRYQVYFGMSLIPLSDIPFELQGGQEYTLFKIPVLNAQDVFSIVNDDWTEANNADYYISLNGVDSTGEIYGISTSVAPVQGGSSAFSASPNPAVAFTTVTLGAGEPATVLLQLMNTAGQVVWTDRVSMGAAPVNRTIDMRAMVPGAYLLQGNWPDGRRTLTLLHP